MFDDADVGSMRGTCIFEQMDASAGRTMFIYSDLSNQKFVLRVVVVDGANCGSGCAQAKAKAGHRQHDVSENMDMDKQADR